MRISDWSSDVCSSDLPAVPAAGSFTTIAFISNLQCIEYAPDGVRSRGSIAVVTRSLLARSCAASVTSLGGHFRFRNTADNVISHRLSLAQVLLEESLATIRGGDRKSTRLNSSH